MRRRNGKRRGISFGTILMLSLTLCVLGALAVVLPRLHGKTNLEIDSSQVLSAMNLSSIPKLSLNDIPIQDSTEKTAAPTVHATPVSTLAPQPTDETQKESESVFTLCAGGSVMVETAVRKSAYYSDAKDYDFTDILSLLAPSMQADLTMVTFENLIASDAKYSETVTPEQTVPMLTTAGVTAVALGFPSVYDQGITGVQSTINALRGKGLAVIGATAQAEQPANPVMLTLGGVKVALLHYIDALDSAGKKKIKKENADTVIPLIDETTMTTDIQQARNAGAQVVVVSLNWGQNGKTAPTKTQQALAQSLADAGADVILGAGSKTVQQVTWLNTADGRKVLCAYSLGMLLGDSRKNLNVAGVLLRLTISVNDEGKVSIVQIQGVPTYIWRYKQDGQYHYRVLPSNTFAPDGMSEDQQTAMTRALKTVQTALEGSPVSLTN